MNRIDRINEKGKKNYFLPTNLAPLPRKVMKRFTKDHPLEEFEQIFMDLMIKGLEGEWGYGRLRSAWNYLTQCAQICYNCTKNDGKSVGCTFINWNSPNPDNPEAPQCRVWDFMEQMETFLGDREYWNEEWRKVSEQPIRKRVKFQSLRKIWNNRWNWKNKELLSEKRITILEKENHLLWMSLEKELENKGEIPLLEMKDIFPDHMEEMYDANEPNPPKSPKYLHEKAISNKGFIP